jgi:hypothetical protein
MRFRGAVPVVMENLSLDGSMILKWILSKDGVRVQAGFSRFRIGYSGELL